MKVNISFVNYLSILKILIAIQMTATIPSEDKFFSHLISLISFKFTCQLSVGFFFSSKSSVVL